MRGTHPTGFIIIYQKHKAHGLVVIGITPERNREKVQAFAKEKGISYPIVLDARPVFKDYKVGQIPDLCLVNSEGLVSALYVGFNPVNEEKMETEVENLLASLRSKFQKQYGRF